MTNIFRRLSCDRAPNQGRRRRRRRNSFDSVLHETILLNLLKNNVNGKFLNVIENMYSKNKICVKIDQNERTEYFLSNVGIRQGDNLSPNLFNLTINKLPEKLIASHCDPIKLNNIDINCLMYANDIVLLSETSKGLQNAINSTIKYSFKQGLEVNTDKTKILVFNKQKRNSKCIFHAGERELEEMKEYKYLGIIFSNSGSLKPA